jgi:ribosomal 50S subunit-recycling heat shock protein
MRLDKCLKVSRLIKRRTIANDACDSERITVNGKVQKASYNVKLGDEITVAFGSKSVTVRVRDIKDTTKKAESVGMYEVVSESNS